MVHAGLVGRRDYPRPVEISPAHQFPPSNRTVHRVLKLAHTIADLAGSRSIQPAYLAEAIQYRPLRQS